ncbi:hypothetical protein BH23BAC3_BH23BAC3_28310 [soil metagenome]
MFIHQLKVLVKTEQSDFFIDHQLENDQVW